MLHRAAHEPRGGVEVLAHRLGRGEQGVDPLDLIDAYGADATRYGLLKMCSTQDVRFAEQKYPGMRCRAIAAQFIDNGVVALFELTLQDGDVKVVDERHYKLVPHSDLDASAIRNYR